MSFKVEKITNCIVITEPSAPSPTLIPVNAVTRVSSVFNPNRTGGVAFSGDLGAGNPDGFITIEMNNGDRFNIPLGSVSNQSSWTKDVAGLNAATTAILAWL